MTSEATMAGKQAADDHLTPGRYLAILEDDHFIKGMWRDSAACVTVCNDFPDDYHPTDWFPSDTYSVPNHVQFVCGECPVRLECLAYAMRTRQDEGIWGGKPERDVKKIRKKLITAIRRIDQREAKELARHKTQGGDPKRHKES